VRPLGFGRALRLGTRAAFSFASAPILLGLLSAAATLCSMLLWMAGLSALVEADVERRLLALLAAALLAFFLQALLLGGAVHQGASALREEPAAPLLDSILAAAPRALPWAVLSGAALLAWSGWQLLLGGSSFLLFVRGLLHGHGGMAGALGLALVASLGPLGALFLHLVTEMALVRAVVRDEPVAKAGWEAALALLARPFAPFGLLLLTTVLAAAVAGTASALSSLRPPGHFRLLDGPALVRLALAGFAVAVAQLVRLDAFLALELGRTGELPEPPVPAAPASVPRAELLPEAGVILEARAVDGPPGTGG
jgi:hypothetical protein